VALTKEKPFFIRSSKSPMAYAAIAAKAFPVVVDC
jgi:hypothetical protein